MKRLLIVCVLFMSACTRVGPGYVGIKVSNAGDNKGVSEIPLQTGWVFYMPGASSVFEYPTFVQQVVLTHDVNEGHPSNEEITFTNADQMRIAADISFAYSLKQEKVPAFYVKFRSDDLNTFTHGYLRSLIRDKFNEVGGTYHIEQIMGDNAEFVSKVKSTVQKDLDPIGVMLEAQFGIIGAPRPPDAVITAINNKLQAVQIAQQKENELMQAKADAAKVVAKAEGDARATQVWSTAQSEANKRMAETITGNLLELKRLEKWNGVLPQVSGGVTPFVNLSNK